MKKINVLSLFDGISCGQLALARAGIEVNKYYASEIEKDAIKITQNNFPETIQLGDIKNWKKWDIDWADIDLICAGSPCQGFSVSGNLKKFEDERSRLFFVFAEILEHVRLFNKNVYFLLENVKMDKRSADIIKKKIGADFIEINSSLVSAQNRTRLYWTNIRNIRQPEDKKIFIKDIIEENGDYEFVDHELDNGVRTKNYWQYDPTGKGYRSQTFRAFFLKGKMGCLESTTPHKNKIMTKRGVRKTTRKEHERLQTVPDNYTKEVSLNKAKCLLGNGWTVDVIAHIFSYMKGERDDQRIF